MSTVKRLTDEEYKAMSELWHNHTWIFQALPGYIRSLFWDRVYEKQADKSNHTNRNGR